MMRYAFRTLRKSPGFTAAAALTLALGIGANTAIFSVLNAMLLHALPYRDPQRLVMVWEANPALDPLIAERVQTCLRNFLEWRSQNHVFEDVVFFRYSGFDLTGSGHPEHVKAALVSPGFFDLLGVWGIRGRTFTVQESEPGKNRVVILSDTIFRSRYGADARLLGQTIGMNGGDYTVVGILPERFHLPALRGGMEELKVDVWTPADIDPARNEADLEARRLYVFSRLKPSVSMPQARAEMVLIAGRLEERYPRLDRSWSASVFPLSAEDLGSGMRRTLLVLQVAVGFVLLIACANVINLQLSRAAVREKEIAVRIALGAGRGRILRQMLGESLLLSAIGGGLGVLLAHWAIAGIVALAPADIHHIEDLHIDGGVLAFTLALAGLTGLLFGLAPAILASRQDPNETLRRGGRWGAGGISARTRRVLVVAEVALSLILLAGAGLMIRSLRSVLQISPGFETSRALSMQVDLRPERYTKAEQAAQFSNELLDRLARLPGVRAAAVADRLPMQSIALMGYRLAGRPAPLPGRAPVADYANVSEDYFRTMGMRIIAGRGFTRHEAEEKNPTVMLVNEALARKLWPHDQAVGQELHSAGNDGPNVWQRSVIGVVSDTRQLGLDEPPRPEMFFPARNQFPIVGVVVSTTGEPMRMASAITSQVWAIDRDQPVHDLMTMEHVVDDTISQRRFNMLLLGIFATTALALATVGIYGVLAYSVSRRTQEIGIRMALGAQPGDVLRLIGREGFTLVLAGIGLGSIGALLLTRLMTSLLFGVGATDALTFVVVPLILAGVAVTACYLPARRASRIAPTIALRYE